MKYIIGEHFEVGHDPDLKTVTFTWLLPDLNDLQNKYKELFDEIDYQEMLDDILEGWKQKEFLAYFHDEETDMFFDEILDKEKRSGTIKDIKVIKEGNRDRITCWWRPPEWFTTKIKSSNIHNSIIKEQLKLALMERLW